MKNACVARRIIVIYRIIASLGSRKEEFRRSLSPIIVASRKRDRSTRLNGPSIKRLLLPYWASFSHRLNRDDNYDSKVLSFLILFSLGRHFDYQVMLDW